MITTIKGDLFAVKRGIIVHGCNAQGVMGSGVAAGVRSIYPKAYEVYRNAYEQTKLVSDAGRGIPAGLGLGTCTIANVAPDLWIVNAVTQASMGPGLQTSYAAVAQCFDFVNYLGLILDQLYDEPMPIHFPKIGAGRGGGDWDQIVQLIEANVDQDRPMFLYVVDEEPIYSR